MYLLYSKTVSLPPHFSVSSPAEVCVYLLTIQYASSLCTPLQLLINIFLHHNVWLDTLQGTWDISQVPHSCWGMAPRHYPVHDISYALCLFHSGGSCCSLDCTTLTSHHCCIQQHHWSHAGVSGVPSTDYVMIPNVTCVWESWLPTTIYFM